MLFRLLKAERMKLRRSPVWIAFLIMPIIPAILGTANFVYQQGVLTHEWYSLWTQHTLFTDYFFLPIMLGVYCAYIMRLEHANHNLNKLFTMPAGRGTIFLSKLITASGMVVLSEAWICALFVISGCLVGLATPPWQQIMIWGLFGSLGGMVMVSIQLVISIFTQSFALPVGISFAGGLSGLVFLAKNLGHIWPYSLMAYGMNSNSPQELLASGYAQFVLICLAYILIFNLISAFIVSKRDI